MIIEVVGLYYHFPLSYCDCAKIIRQFKISVHPTTIKGIEVISALYKESRREITFFDFSPWEEIDYLLKTA